MKAQELRIGNLIYWDIPEKENVIHTVVGIRNNTPNTIPISLGNSIEDYKPILLTHELLEKAGFIYSGIYYYFPNSGIFKLEYFETKKYYILRYRQRHIESVEVKYFHHLQNLIFDLTGEEIGI